MSSPERTDIQQIAFVGQMPPPFHGQAIANQVLATGTYEHLLLHTIPTDMSENFADVGKWSWKKSLRLLALRRRLREVAAIPGCDTAYYSMGFLNLVGGIKDAVLLRECRKRFRRVIVHLHTGSMTMVLDKLGGIGRQTFGRVFNSADAWILLSPEMNDFHRIFSPRRVYHLPNGVHVPEELSSTARWEPLVANSSVPNIVFMSNLFASKGTDVLIQAGRILRQRGIPFKMQFVGSWPTENRPSELMALAQREGIAEQVDFLGPRFGDEKWQILRSSDIFCMPTYFSGEAMPLSIIEAMACGLPIVSTHWRAIPDLVTDGENGFLVACQDANTLAERLSELLRDHQLRQRMGQAARQRFLDRHTIEQFHHGFERIMTDFHTLKPSATVSPAHRS